jgi:ribosomal protein S18 acetylase RimI-like enzyme
MVRQARPDDVEALARTLLRAFFDDPVVVWMFPSESRRSRVGERAYRMFLRRIYLPHDQVFVDEGLQSVALWAPPGRWRLPVRTQLRMAPGMVRAFGPRRVPLLVRGLTAIEEHHPDHVAHWHLGILGTDPAHQGRGLASSVMAPVLGRCDADGVPAYLESSKHANIAFYRRHGFEVVNEISLPDGPTIWGMWREPRGMDGTG